MKNNYIIHSIYRIVFISLLLPPWVAYPVYSDNQPQLSNQTSTLNQQDNSPKCDCPIQLDRIKEFGGEVVIDGSMRVLEPLMGKVFDMVEISTPVTPAANHSRLFLRADGSKSSLVIIFDDGTTTKIVGN